MNLLRHGLIAALLVSAAGPAMAAGIERNAPAIAGPNSVLFEDGRYLQFTLRHVSPDLEGVAGAGAPTGNLFEDYLSFGAAYKADLTDRLSYALILDEPWGVDTLYTGPAPYTGTEAHLSSRELQGIVAFDATPGIKVYGGIRAQQMDATASIPFVGGYTIDTDRQLDFGYLLGAAYQRPEIALRVALTYYSAIGHDFNSTEFGALSSVTEVETPQAVNLEFQTGVAEGTLVYGSVRWVDWSEFRIDPPNYPLATPLVDYEEDWTTYTLGVGRRLNENLSAFAQVSHEPASDTTLTTLGPVDGRTSLGLGVTWQQDNVRIRAGLNYTWLGEAQNVLATEFDDGRALAAGVSIGFSL
jgi:long-subunit fatty acid transport protein